MAAKNLPTTGLTYEAPGLFDELIHYAQSNTGCDLLPHLLDMGLDTLRTRQQGAELAIESLGITFTIYSEGQNIDRAWPFDIIPRCIPDGEWQQLEAGLLQRSQALNAFIHDLYNDQKIIKDKKFPGELLDKSKNFLPPLIGANPRFGVWAHVCGSDLIRDKDGVMYVLEDNLRVPSGVSYMLENRQLTKRVFPELFQRYHIRPVDDYPSQLYDVLASLHPRDQKPNIVVLTPGVYNSAYFEHAYLAQQMGVELVEAGDLLVDDDKVYKKTIRGLQRVDVIYRRVDDLYMDPTVFIPDSLLGIPGIIKSWLKGNVAIANAPGSGVADDKVVYSYMPDIIRYYLGEEAKIPNVPTYRCNDPVERRHVIKNMHQLVIKPANESGGYGIMIGNRATRVEREAYAARIEEDPRNYIAQPILSPSTCPTLVEEGMEPRHLDLRPFILQGKKGYVTAGGLTRVALRRGSLVVNSSQGGGSKDTWIVAGRRD
ncbi:protein of unknown function DUF404 [Magnetococcus marinus MC-1]|uniref:Circularly permuted ATP-grasp type 2 domain-containing protein n=1 Tax=Magnetococcus marinus (strain ATCC BAA-1437 / JCM 17883 / MC-1) TaxID=156889 RepID=A0L4N2_MAGMM|nr:circularly permuted type 2 ATP-grasp protein [Magnetococcus marinus]ABK42925.1 protein of unknown function DUF404 [Magnetococcus marinus MC-1]